MPLRPNQRPAILDPLDQRIVQALVNGLELTERPYQAIAKSLHLSEAKLLERIQKLLADGAIRHIGPLYSSERLGVAVELAAMQVPDERLEAACEILQTLPQVVYGALCEHPLNLWMLLAGDAPEELAATLRQIAERTGARPFRLSRQEVFHGHSHSAI